MRYAKANEAGKRMNPKLNTLVGLSFSGKARPP
jgi:hypothetical protein